MKVVLYSNKYATIDIGGSDTIELLRFARVPLVDEMLAADLTVVLGPLDDADAAMELAGRVKLALEQGVTIVFCFSARLSEVELRILPDIAPFGINETGDRVEAIGSDPAPHRRSESTWFSTAIRPRVSVSSAPSRRCSVT